jgi:hypothetical protein
MTMTATSHVRASHLNNDTLLSTLLDAGNGVSDATPSIHPSV